MKLLSYFATLVAGTLIGGGLALHAPKLMNHTAQPYAGQDQRQIASLSAEDIATLEKGEGWSLAKPAELNGYPGPAHVLEFAEELNLEPQQKERIEASFQAMKAKAVDLGKALIEAEAALDKAFKSGSVTSDILSKHLQLAGNIRSSLRAAHLYAHMEITPILTQHQRQRYAELRGYAGGHHVH